MLVEAGDVIGGGSAITGTTHGMGYSGLGIKRERFDKKRVV